MKRFQWEKKYIQAGVTAFLVIVASLAFYMIFQNMSSVRGALNKLTTVLSPVGWGLVIAYVLNPLVKLFERKCFSKVGKRVCKTEKKLFDFRRMLSILLAEVVLCMVLVLLVYMVVPQVYFGVESVVNNSPEYLEQAKHFVKTAFSNTPALQTLINENLDKIAESITQWATDTLLPQLSDIVAVITTSIYQVARGMLNFVIGIVLSVYLLFNKRAFLASLKKLIYGVFKFKHAEQILRALHFTNRAFSGFLHGKLLDSAIIGVICFFACKILGFPYAMLISVIIGITNIVPFFGPIIGAVPCALIILMFSPVKVFVFIIFIIILQSFDGNVLGPKILSNTIGLSGFWIMFAILVGGGLFGFWGMVLGVPVFTVLYTGLKRLINYLLERRRLPVDTAEYYDLHHIDRETRECVSKKQAEAAEKAAAPEQAENL